MIKGESLGNGRIEIVTRPGSPLMKVIVKETEVEQKKAELSQNGNAENFRLGKKVSGGSVELLYNMKLPAVKYSVPEDKADEFIATFKKENKKATLIPATVGLGVGALGGFGVYKLFSKNASKLLKFPIAGMAAFLLGVGSAAATMVAMIKNMAKKESTILNKFDAQKLDISNNVK